MMGKDTRCGSFPRVTVVMMMVGGKVWHFQKGWKGLIQKSPEGGILSDG